MCPSTDPENATPGIALIAADCAGLHRGRFPQPGGGVVQTIRPSSRRSANMPPPAFGIRVGAVAVGQHDPTDIRQPDIGVRLVRGRSPLDATHGPTLPDPGLPQHLALLVGVERVDDAVLLARHECASTVRQRHENRRRAEVEVGPVRLGAVRLVRQAAGGRVGVRRPSSAGTTGHGLTPDRAPRTRRSTTSSDHCSCCRW